MAFRDGVDCTAKGANGHIEVLGAQIMGAVIRAGLKQWKVTIAAKSRLPRLSGSQPSIPFPWRDTGPGPRPWPFRCRPDAAAGRKWGWGCRLPAILGLAGGADLGA
jgi:hypothetical protein